MTKNLNTCYFEEALQISLSQRKKKVKLANWHFSVLYSKFQGVLSVLLYSVCTCLCNYLLTTFNTLTECSQFTHRMKCWPLAAQIPDFDISLKTFFFSFYLNLSPQQKSSFLPVLILLRVSYAFVSFPSAHF